MFLSPECRRYQVWMYTRATRAYKLTADTTRRSAFNSPLYNNIKIYKIDSQMNSLFTSFFLLLQKFKPNIVIRKSRIKYSDGCLKIWPKKHFKKTRNVIFPNEKLNIDWIQTHTHTFCILVRDNNLTCENIHFCTTMYLI